MGKPKDGPRPICFNGFSGQEALLNGLPRRAPRTLPPQDSIWKSTGTPNIRRPTEVRGEGQAANYTIDLSGQFTYWLCWELDYRQQLNPSLWKSILGPEGQHSSMGAGTTQLGTLQPPDGM